MQIMPSGPGSELVGVPASVRFPVELAVPEGFDPEDPTTWPRVEGRLEWVEGRLLWMPPCGARQQGVATSVVGLLDAWGAEHADFFVGSNEAGMKLGEDARGAEAAVWRRAGLGELRDKYIRRPPILAVEVEGREESELELRAKAEWYLARGVSVVWLVLTRTREVLVLRADGESRLREGETLPAQPELPGLAPPVARFFRQLG